MKIKWIKSTDGAKFYPVTHERAILCGDEANKTLEEKLGENQRALDERLAELLPKTGTAADANKLGGLGPEYYAKSADLAEYLPIAGGNVASLTVGGQAALHKGNSAPVAVQSSAPSDTSALWVW